MVAERGSCTRSAIWHRPRALVGGRRTARRCPAPSPTTQPSVFGAARFGLVTTAALRAAGVQIIVVEPAAVRKQKAPIADADHVIDPTTSTDVVSEVRELTKGRGADVSFECAGIDAVLKSAILDPSRRDVRERRDLGPRRHRWR